MTSVQPDGTGEAEHPLTTTPSPLERVSAELARWLQSDAEHTLGSLVALFGKRAFAVLFTVLLAVPAIPAPTGGITHLFEAVALLLALELIAGREEVWLPERWRTRRIAATGRLMNGLLRLIRFLERWSRPRLRWLFGHRLSNFVFGLLVACGSLAAFLAPPFSGLDTLPALGVVILSLGVLVEDAAAAALGTLVLAVGIALAIFVGDAAIEMIDSLL